MANSKLIFLFIALLVGVAACSDESENGKNADNNDRVRTTVVETTVLEKTTYSDYVRLTGSLESVDDAVVSAQASGRVLNIVERGQRLREGDIIAELDDELLQASYRVAKTNYEMLTDVYNRQQPLHADSIVSTLEFNQIVAQKEQAQAQLNQAERQLKDAKIRAPFSGRVEERMVRTGELLNPGMPVVRLVNSSRVKVSGGIPERYALDITEGTNVRVNLSSYGGDELEAKVTYTGSVIDPNSRTLPVEIEIPNPDSVLKPEMMVGLQITRKVLDDVITVPRTALIRGDEGLNIFVAREENGHKVARLVRVTTAQSSGNRVIISDGLSAGDEIVIVGQTLLNEGDRLDIVRTHEYAGGGIENTTVETR